MAHIRKHPKTGNHQVRWRDPATGKERNKSFERSTDARAFKRKIEAAIDQDTYIDRRHSETSFQTFAEGWLANRLRLRPSSRTRDESYLRNHVLSRFGTYTVGRIRKSDIQDWIGDLSSRDLRPPRSRNATGS